jgi:transcriptional regulator with XRE-family HTH domain
MVRLLNFQVTSARVSEYEKGIREPNLLVLLAYARAAGISVEEIIDDDIDPHALS